MPARRSAPVPWPRVVGANFPPFLGKLADPDSSYTKSVENSHHLWDPAASATLFRTRDSTLAPHCQESSVSVPGPAPGLSTDGTFVQNHSLVAGFQLYSSRPTREQTAAAGPGEPSVQPSCTKSNPAVARHLLGSQTRIRPQFSIPIWVRMNA